jgi:hypothetical protein
VRATANLWRQIESDPSGNADVDDGEIHVLERAAAAAPRVSALDVEAFDDQALRGKCAERSIVFDEQCARHQAASGNSMLTANPGPIAEQANLPFHFAAAAG